MNPRYSLGYILLGIAALALFAIPLWYGYRDNLGTFRAYVPGAEMQRLADLFQRDGTQAAAAAVEAYLPSLPPDEVIVFADPDKRRLAGNLPAWPAEVPDVPGTYGLVIGLEAGQSMRVVVSYQTLPGGYRLLMGRESVRFQSLVERFWYGIAGAVAVVLGLGALFAWRLRRSLLLQIDKISCNAAAIVEGDLSRRLPASGGSPELDALAQTMNRMLEQLHGALQRQTKYLDELFDLAPDAIVLTEMNPSRIVRVNREFTRMFGYTSEEAVGRSLRELIAPGELEAEYAANAAAVAAGKRVDVEVVRQRKDGTRLHVHFSSAAIKTDDGKSAAYLVYRDITERKLAEEELRRSQHYLAEAQRLSHIGSWAFNAAGFRHWSPELLKIHGLDPSGKAPSIPEYVGLVHPEDRDFVVQEIERMLAGAPGFDFTKRIVRPDGAIRRVRCVGTRATTGGIVPEFVGTGMDVTEQERAEEELRASEARFRSLTELSSDWYWEQDENLRFTYLSNQALDLTGYSGESSLGKTRWEIVNMTPLSCSWPEHQAVLAAHQPFRDLECRRVGPDGTTRYLSISGAPIFDEQGRFKGYRGIGRNITERKGIEEALRLSEERYALALEASEEGHFDTDLETGEIFVSARLNEIYGFPRHANTANRVEFLNQIPFHPDDRHLLADIISADWDDPAQVSRMERYSARIVPRPGETRWIQTRAMVTRDAQGRARRRVGVIADITERKLAEEALRLSQERYAYAMEAAQDAHWDWIVGTDEYYTSPRVVDVFGLPPGTTFTSRKDYLAKTNIVKEDLQAWMRAAEELFAGTGSHLSMELRAIINGEVRWIQHNGLCVRDASGRVVRWCGSVRDVTERRRAEEALRQSEERYALAVAGSNEGIFDWDLVSDRAYVSYRAQELFGLPRGELWRPRRDWRNILTFHPEDAPRLHDSIKAHIRGSAPTYDVEFRIVVPGGGVRWFRQRGIALRDASGKAYRVVGSIGDVTEKHKAEEDLRRLERQLRQAQRLEAMGTLAGGIAHDFNNILGAILGYGEMALRDASKGSRLARDLDSIIVAGERGRALVDRVLAFSRSAVGERVPVHVEKVVREALGLISPKLPPNVTLHAKLHTGRAALLGDATQVHQVLMNLATNAVHAMPSGGTLRVSLSAARLEAARTPTVGIMPAGDCLILEVADSGTGIAPEILDRIFDPFFTTKDVGTGTGLGLSLVHGIVAELGGAIDVASTPGAGSTFTVYLPRSGDALDSSQQAEPELPRGDGQRVLVVDDEEPLVRLATRTLEELGYVATGFTSSAAALSAFRADPQRFDALITDERMPGMSGSALIREVRGIRGGIPIVLMSGFVGGAVASRAREAGAEEVLKKPLSARDLAVSLARVLQA